MNFKKYIAPSLIALLGGAGYFVRSKELELASDPVSGLFESWHPMSLVAVVLAAAACAGAVMAALAVKQGRSGGANNTVSWGMIDFILGLLASALLAVGAHMYSSGLWYSTFEVPWLENLFVMFASFSAIAAVIIAFYANQPDPWWLPKLFCCVPPVFLCIWLLYYYRVNAVNPALQDFVPQCLALACASLGSFGFAGHFYGVLKPASTVGLLLAAEYFTIVSMAGQTEVDTMLLLAGVLILSFTMVSAVISDSLGKSDPGKH